MLRKNEGSAKGKLVFLLHFRVLSKFGVANVTEKRGKCKRMEDFFNFRKKGFPKAVVASGNPISIL